tara:strand:- start:778 stop:1164 length:387 start_codon:yes stop_codon:yes gene_type:complete
MAIENIIDLDMHWVWEATILGEPASKSNSRQIVRMGGKPRLIKSKKALSYIQAFSLQVPKINQPIEGDVLMWCRIHYASRRPDLDESLIMDMLQASGVIVNDRQIKAKIILWALDRETPRADIKLASM